MSRDALEIVLRHMLKHGSTSAPQLWEELGMAQVTSSRTMRRLLARKLIEHTGYGPRKPCARPPRLYMLTLAGKVEAAKPLRPLPEPVAEPRVKRQIVGYGHGIGKVNSVFALGAA